MSTIVLGCDSNTSNDKEYQDTVANALEKAGYTVEKLGINPSAFANYSYSSEAKGKIGIYLMAASLISFLDGAKSQFDYCYFGIRGDASDWGKSEKNFNSKGVPKDHHGDCTLPECDKYRGKTYPQLNEIYKDRCCATWGDTPQKLADNILAALSGVSTTASNNQDTKGDEDEDEEWDDKDNFTPHKGNIMEIKPYKEISSINFDKSYDSPSGSGTVEVVFKSKDYKYIYKGVAMKLKLRRSCDSQWSATGVEEPDYDENEKFFKEHIPTSELLKELGLPDYKKNYGIQIKSNNNLSNNSDDDSEENDNNSTKKTNKSLSSSSNPSASGKTSNNKTVKNNSSNTGLKRLSNNYINTLNREQALNLAKQTNKYDSVTIKRLRRRALGLTW